MEIQDILKLIWPIIVLQLSVQIYAIYDLIKSPSTKTLSKGIWALIVILGELLGSIAYFVFGKGYGESIDKE